MKLLTAAIGDAAYRQENTPDPPFPNLLFKTGLTKITAVDILIEVDYLRGLRM